MANCRDPDAEFFILHPDRYYHIRRPQKNECEAEFRSLGDHLAARRRMILWRVSEDNPWYNPVQRPLLKVPMLAFADESIEDSDEVLGPIWNGLMRDARRKGRN